MTTLLCREFAELATDASGQVIAAGKEPGLRDSVVSNGNPITLLKETRFVELHAVSTDMRYRFRADVDADSMVVVTGSTVFKGVDARKGDTQLYAAP